MGLRIKRRFCVATYCKGLVTLDSELVPPLEFLSPLSPTTGPLTLTKALAGYLLRHLCLGYPSANFGPRRVPGLLLLPLQSLPRFSYVFRPFPLDSGRFTGVRGPFKTDK